MSDLTRALHAIQGLLSLSTDRAVWSANGDQYRRDLRTAIAALDAASEGATVDDGLCDICNETKQNGTHVSDGQMIANAFEPDALHHFTPSGACFRCLEPRTAVRHRQPGQGSSLFTHVYIGHG